MSEIKQFREVYIKRQNKAQNDETHKTIAKFPAMTFTLPVALGILLSYFNLSLITVKIICY